MANEEKVVVATKNNDVFIKAGELTALDFKKLPEIMCVLKKTVSKKGFVRCQILVKIHDLLQLEIPISHDRFNYFRLKLGLPLYDSSKRERYTNTIHVIYRIYKGNSTVGKYSGIELIFKQYVYENYFFISSDQRNILSLLEENKEININWLQRPDKIDVADVKNFVFED